MPLLRRKRRLPPDTIAEAFAARRKPESAIDNKKMASK